MSSNDDLPPSYEAVFGTSPRENPPGASPAYKPSAGTLLQDDGGASRVITDQPTSTRTRESQSSDSSGRFPPERGVWERNFVFQCSIAKVSKCCTWTYVFEITEEYEVLMRGESSSRGFCCRDRDAAPIYIRDIESGASMLEIVFEGPDFAGMGQQVRISSPPGEVSGVIKRGNSTPHCFDLLDVSSGKLFICSEAWSYDFGLVSQIKDANTNMDVANVNRTTLGLKLTLTQGAVSSSQKALFVGLLLLKLKEEDEILRGS